jgi:hypothetical protein
VNALASVQRVVTRFERDVYVVAGVARRSRAGRGLIELLRAFGSARAHERDTSHE